MPDAEQICGVYLSKHLHFGTCSIGGGDNLLKLHTYIQFASGFSRLVFGNPSYFFEWANTYSEHILANTNLK